MPDSPLSNIAAWREERVRHWDAVAGARKAAWAGGCYHRRLQRVYRHIVPKNSRVLEIGCGQGDLLAAVGPAYGVGIDFSEKAVERAREKHAGLRFIVSTSDEFALQEKLTTSSCRTS